MPFGTDVKLVWQTANERTNKGFYVERSLNGAGFSSVGFVPGGTSSAGDYTFTDIAVPPGAALYRLKQEDVDGWFHFSPVISIAVVEKQQKIVWSVGRTNKPFFTYHRRLYGNNSIA